MQKLCFQKGIEMFENIAKFFKKLVKSEAKDAPSKDTAKERLHLVLMQDRANVSVDFLDLMRQEIIEVIKKYIDIDEKAMDVRLENKENEDGTQGAPALYANIPIINIKEKAKKLTEKKASEKKEEIEAEIKETEKNEEQKENKTTKEEKKEDKTETNKEKVKVTVEKTKEEKQENNSEKESENE